MQPHPRPHCACYYSLPECASPEDCIESLTTTGKEAAIYWGECQLQSPPGPATKREPNPYSAHVQQATILCACGIIFVVETAFFAILENYLRYPYSIIYRDTHIIPFFFLLFYSSIFFLPTILSLLWIVSQATRIFHVYHCVGISRIYHCDNGSIMYRLLWSQECSYQNCSKLSI